MSFLDSTVLLCDIHCEQSWERWLSCGSNGVREKKDLILPILRNIAKAESVEDYQKQLGIFKSSEIWKSSESTRLRYWMLKTWLPNYKVS